MRALLIAWAMVAASAAVLRDPTRPAGGATQRDAAVRSERDVLNAAVKALGESYVLSVEDLKQMAPFLSDAADRASWLRLRLDERVERHVEAVPRQVPCEELEELAGALPESDRPRWLKQQAARIAIAGIEKNAWPDSADCTQELARLQGLLGDEDKDEWSEAVVAELADQPDWDHLAHGLGALSELATTPEDGQQVQYRRLCSQMIDAAVRKGLWDPLTRENLEALGQRLAERDKWLGEQRDSLFEQALEQGQRKWLEKEGPHLPGGREQLRFELRRRKATAQGAFKELLDELFDKCAPAQDADKFVAWSRGDLSLSMDGEESAVLKPAACIEDYVRHLVKEDGELHCTWTFRARAAYRWALDEAIRRADPDTALGTASDGTEISADTLKNLRWLAAELMLPADWPASGIDQAHLLRAAEDFRSKGLWYCSLLCSHLAGGTPPYDVGHLTDYASRALSSSGPSDQEYLKVLKLLAQGNSRPPLPRPLDEKPLALSEIPERSLLKQEGDSKLLAEIQKAKAARAGRKEPEADLFGLYDCKAIFAPKSYMLLELYRNRDGGPAPLLGIWLQRENAIPPAYHEYAYRAETMSELLDKVTETSPTILLCNKIFVAVDTNLSQSDVTELCKRLCDPGVKSFDKGVGKGIESCLIPTASVLKKSWEEKEAFFYLWQAKQYRWDERNTNRIWTVPSGELDIDNLTQKPEQKPRVQRIQGDCYCIPFQYRPE